jgi:hypothetical protein
MAATPPSHDRVICRTAALTGRPATSMHLPLPERAPL